MAPTNTDTYVAHDLKLCELYEAAGKAIIHWSRCRSAIRRAADLRPRHEQWRNGKPVLQDTTFEEDLAYVERAIREGLPLNISFSAKAQDLIDAHVQAEEAMNEAQKLQMDHERGYTGWPRFWLVTSSAGHVHSTPYCSSFRPTTTFALVPELSGRVEAEAVSMLGEALCTVCFPSAPVNPISIPKGVASLAGKPEFAAALAKWQAKVAADNAHKEAMAAEGKRKRPRRSRYESLQTYLQRYPASEGWYS